MSAKCVDASSTCNQDCMCPLLINGVARNFDWEGHKMQKLCDVINSL